MDKTQNYYSDKIVYKPWGQKHVVYNNKNDLAITLIDIKYGHKTSLHSHPKKKTGFIILDGTALVQIGLYKKNVKKFKPLSRLVIRPGLFHSLKADSKKGMCALEFETPYMKNDLIRLEDSYGRQSKSYEGKKHTKKIIDNSLAKFKKPKLGKKNIYKFKNLEILIETKKNFNKFSKKNDKTTTAILDGRIVDNKGQDVIKTGEIVKTSTLCILAKKFKIKKPITILKVSRKNK